MVVPDFGAAFDLALGAGVVGGGVAGRPAEVADQDQRGPLLQRVGQGGQRGADAQVVGDVPVVDGHVEVGSQQHPLALEGRQVLERGDAQPGHG